MNELDDAGAIAYLLEHIVLLEDPPHAQPGDTLASGGFFDVTLAD